MTGIDDDRPRSTSSITEVLSISEELLRERGRRTDVVPTELRPVLDFVTLQQMPMEELQGIAEIEKIDGYAKLDRQELIFQVLRSRMQSS